jgi:hypothetical protein
VLSPEVLAQGPINGYSWTVFSCLLLTFVVRRGTELMTQREDGESRMVAGVKVLSVGGSSSSDKRTAEESQSGLGRNDREQRGQRQ